MLESFMEDLLWKYPDDFFPGRGFKPVARQFTLSGAGRLDISFRDNLDRLWVIEVKAVPIRTDVADQVYRYAQSLRDAHPNDRPFPAVVAPVINATVREHFDRWGIEYYEITEAMFRRVATERGVEMEAPEPTTAKATAHKSATAPKTRAGPGPLNGWYNLQSNATSGKWADPANWVWHYRKDGTTACGAHTLPKIAEREDAAYVLGPKPEGAPGRNCAKCEAQADKDSS